LTFSTGDVPGTGGSVLPGAHQRLRNQKGPSLNAVVLLNPIALQTADELDAV
jgi:hypothetical protein